MADNHTIYKNGAKEIAHLQGKAAHLHGQADDRRAGLQLPHPLVDLGRRRRPSAVRRRRRPHGISPIVPRTGWAASWRTPASCRCASPRSSTATSATSPTPGPRPRSCGRRQPHLRAAAGRPRASDAGRVTHPRRRLQPLHRLRRDRSPPASTGSTASLDCGDPYVGNGYTATDVERIPWNIVEAIEAVRGSELSPGRPSARTCTSTCCTPPRGVEGVQQRRHRVGAAPQLRADLSAGSHHGDGRRSTGLRRCGDQQERHHLVAPPALAAPGCAQRSRSTQGAPPLRSVLVRTVLRRRRGSATTSGSPDRPG